MVRRSNRRGARIGSTVPRGLAACGVLAMILSLAASGVAAADSAGGRGPGAPGATASNAAGQRRPAQAGERAPVRRGRGAVADQPVPGKPWLVWEQERFDFGMRFTGGAPIFGEFGFRNEGEADLILRDVEANCGCTDVFHDDVVPPGESGRIRFEINSSKWFSDETKMSRIYVRTNCPGHPLSVLELVGEVVPAVDVVPKPRIEFRNLRQDRPSEENVELISHIDAPMKPGRIQSDNPRFTARIEPLEEGRRYRLTVTAHPPFRYGRDGGSIKVDTGLEMWPQVIVTAATVLAPPISIHPTAVRLRPGEPREGHYDVVVRSSEGSRPVDIVKADVTDSLIKVQLFRRSARDPARVRLIVPPRYREGQSGVAILTIETSDAEFKTFKVPIGTTKNLMESGILDRLAPGQAGGRVPDAAPPVPSVGGNDVPFEFVGPPAPADLARDRE